jgi:diguanylate cyclase (GGDEF)-like protein
MVRRLRSLRMRIALTLAGMLIIVSVVGVGLISVVNLNLFRQQASAELQRGEHIFNQLMEQHDRQLIQAAQLLAADFGFRSALASSDEPTIISALDNQRTRIDADLALISDLEGRIIADSEQRIAAGQAYPFPALLALAQQQGQASAIKLLGGEPYAVVIVPVRSPLTVGWVTMGLKVDDRMAQEFRLLSGLEVSFVMQAQQTMWQVIASTLPMSARQDIRHVDPLQEKMTLAGVTYQSRFLSITQAAPQIAAVGIVLQRPLDEILAPFYALLKAMLLLALVSLLLIGFASLRISRVVTRPLHQLVEVAQRIRDGDYQQHIERPDTLEVAELAWALSHMQDAIAEREKQVLALVYHDPLTGLYNRTGFLRELERCLGDQSAHTVMLLNIDRFQQINDTLGHPFGDEVLKAFARLLQQLVSSKDGILARLSGDEFAILVAEDQPWQQLTQQLLAHFDAPFVVADRQLDVHATIGVAHYPEHADSAVNVLCCADEAMYVAKSERKALSLYDPHRQQFREDHLSLLGELKRAVEQDELLLYYQPKVSLQDGHTQEAEALIRWQHPTRGFVPPFEFIPFAEQTGYIREITRWVIKRGCQDAAWFRAQGYTLRLSVNIATRDLLDVHLPEYVHQCLLEADIPAALLCLEITESGVMEESQQVMDNLHRLRAMGLALAIDDYGTGYSSLAYVRHLPVSELKIDRSFVKGVAESHTDAMIVHSTIELAHSLNFKVVAEGVETEAVSDRLRELGCDLGQGYLYAKPLPREALYQWLDTETVD